MRLIAFNERYAYYVGVDEKGEAFYNVVPKDQQKPNAGYYSSAWICSIKKVKNLFLEF